jgi:hypothetical protein
MLGRLILFLICAKSFQEFVTRKNHRLLLALLILLLFIPNYYAINFLESSHFNLFVHQFFNKLNCFIKSNFNFENLS